MKSSFLWTHLDYEDNYPKNAPVSTPHWGEVLPGLCEFTHCLTKPLKKPFSTDQALETEVATSDGQGASFDIVDGNNIPSGPRVHSWISAVVL